MPLEDFISNKLNKLKSMDQLRSLDLYTDSLIDFSSNDYLGLVKKDFVFENLKSGSTGSRLITGNSPDLELLEKEIATWKKTEAAIFFGSGYLANLGAISALAGPRDVIFSDELNHSCILDGIRLSGAKKYFYRNLDINHLKELLIEHRSKYQNAFVITDTVFSMQGTCADLKSIIDLKQEFDFSVYIDEAHATGTMGLSGAGLYASLVEQNQVKANQVEVQMGTFSKACGVEGAYVAGSKVLIEYLINFARTFIYSTAPSPYVVAMVRQNLSRLVNADEERKSLSENIEYLRQKLDSFNVDYQNDQTPIFSVVFESNKKVLELSEKLLLNKILVKAIRPPTVPQPCLRICIHSDHKKEDLDKLISLLF
jgi:8-amino-7-oxononanoate synthase